MINNTLKHAKAKLITIKIMRTTNEIQLDFQDDGIGFDTSQNTEGIGIQNLRKKANDVNGQLTIESEAGKGTNIHLTLQTDNF
jgi:signal transduction histidine kinase